MISGLDQIWSGEGPYYLGVSVYRSLCNMNYSSIEYEKLETDEQMVGNVSIEVEDWAVCQAGVVDDFINLKASGRATRTE